MEPLISTIESSLQTPDMIVRLVNYEFGEAGLFERRPPQNYITHVLSSDSRNTLARLGMAQRREEQFIETGALQFNPVDVPIQFRNVASTVRVSQCIFQSDAFDAAIGPGPAWRQDMLRGCLDIRNPRIRSSMLQLEQELAAPGFDSLILAEALGRVLMVEISRHMRCDHAPRRQGGRLSNRQIDGIIDYVDAHCGSGAVPSTRDLAELCAISPGHLMRSFRNATGQTLRGFIEQIRLDKARRLLVQSDMPLKSIAAATGFPTPSRFSERFRRTTGEQPSQYRARHRTGGRYARDGGGPTGRPR